MSGEREDVPPGEPSWWKGVVDSPASPFAAVGLTSEGIGAFQGSLVVVSLQIARIDCVMAIKMPPSPFSA